MKWMRGQVEEFMENYEKGLFINGNRQMFCWMDSVSPHL